MRTTDGKFTSSVERTDPDALGNVGRTTFSVDVVERGDEDEFTEH